MDKKPHPVGQALSLVKSVPAFWCHKLITDFSSAGLTWLSPMLSAPLVGTVSHAHWEEVYTELGLVFPTSHISYHHHPGFIGNLIWYHGILCIIAST